MRTATAPTKLSAVLGATVIALSGCSGGGSGDKGTAASGAAHSSGSSSSSSGAPAQVAVKRLGDATKITDNGISPEKLQKDVATPITKAAADQYAATVKPDEAWAKELATKLGGGATASAHLDKVLESDVAEAQAAATQKVFPARCTDMPHLTNLVSHPTGSTFGRVVTGDNKVALYYAKLGKGTKIGRANV